ncbi:uncharacterized protein LOC122043129 isoform X3 [Zingiber officinale]|uniref:uncharacterized protein LOC122043129 isoform X3 n=1 Tax=Zingiber officinale TaxID=94328 RepID=UPI001C4D50F0|nr:uncharacterized protein LOC122043129 isoform X3 [Zingiber officinale]
MAFNPLLSIFSNHFISFSTRRRFGAHQAKKKKKKKKKTGGDGGMKRSASELVLEALFHHHGDDRSSPSLSLEELLLPAAMGFGWLGHQFHVIRLQKQIKFLEEQADLNNQVMNL